MKILPTLTFLMSLKQQYAAEAPPEIEEQEGGIVGMCPNPIASFDPSKISTLGISEQCGRHSSESIKSAQKVVARGDALSVEQVEILLEESPELLKEPDATGRNAMTIAVEAGKTEIIKLILETSPELLKEPDRNRWTAMTIAVAAGKTEVIKLILETSPELLKEPDRSGINLMTNAVRVGNTKIIELILEKSPELLKEPDLSGMNAITLAPAAGKTKIIELILEKAPELLKEQDRTGRHAMTLAAAEGKTKIIELILEKSPELLKEPDRTGMNAITLAAAEGKTEIIELILEKAPELLKEQDGTGRNVMTLAAAEGKTEIVKLILEKAPELLKEQDGTGRNAMTKAVRAGNTKIIELILETSPELLKEQDGNGVNAIQSAVFRINTEVLKRVLEKNPELLKDRYLGMLFMTATLISLSVIGMTILIGNRVQEMRERNETERIFEARALVEDKKRELLVEIRGILETAEADDDPANTLILDVRPKLYEYYILKSGYPDEFRSSDGVEYIVDVTLEEPVRSELKRVYQQGLKHDRLTPDLEENAKFLNECPIQYFDIPPEHAVLYGGSFYDGRLWQDGALNLRLTRYNAAVRDRLLAEVVRENRENT